MHRFPDVQVDSVECAPVWGAERSDNVYDAVMAHYQVGEGWGVQRHHGALGVETPIASHHVGV
eukprot:352909-Chlamydomonas_euryale.AAC.3